MVNLRVGFLLLHPFSESMASGVRTFELAKGLSKMGVETLIFTPYERTRFEDGVKIVKVPTLFSTLGVENYFYHFTRRIYYSKAMQRLVIRMAKHMLSGKIQPSQKLQGILEKSKLDILQAEQDNAALMLLPCVSHDLPIVLDLHGIWPVELLSANAIREGSKEWVDLQNIINYVIENVDLTVCLSDAMRKYVLSNYHVDASRVVVVPPGGCVFCDEYLEREPPLKVVYAGIVSYRKHVDLFVRSMPHIKKGMANVEFWITRKGDLLKSIQGLAKALGVEPVYFWFSKFTEMRLFLLSCHVGVLPSVKDTSAMISMPSKLFDYMSAGLPVVANDVGGWTEIIKKFKIGRVSEDDPLHFANCILELLSDPEELKRCGKNGIQAIKTCFNWSKSAENLLNCYKKLV